ncbi:MAG: DNA repair protein RadA [Halopseudomonas aestusnigri]|nr:DNA repair protein RadA [Halopseudomonas aestusnigri]
MAKSKSVYVCQNCGADSAKWMGRCNSCGQWNTFVEQRISQGPARSSTLEKGTYAVPEILDEVQTDQVTRIDLKNGEFNRVLGGGIVPGSLILIGGEPGIGKSTLLLHLLASVADEKRKVLYVSGEESARQIKMRARRLDAIHPEEFLATENSVEQIIAMTLAMRPSLLAVDSIQTLTCSEIASSPGSVTQVRESAYKLLEMAKKEDIPIVLVGHVTKDGAIAGPKVLEHMVDTVLYFEGEADGRYRMLRAVKNRFGAVNELGVFAMTDKGLKEVANPSAIFLSRYDAPIPGSVVMATWEGSRPMLVEVQALVDTSHLGNPRRVTLGLDQNRLAMLLAVLHRHGGVATYDQDVFVNVVGGVKVLETAADLALLAAVMSSLRNRPLPMDLMVFGELGLSGEIRPVPSGQERLKEAAKHGFTRAIVPKANAPKEAPKGMQVIAVTRLDQALAAIFE